MNQERPNELRAKQIVERVAGIKLDHADTHGGVDYLSPDGSIALEVTAVTEGQNEGARQALRKSTDKGATNAPLQKCWLVFIEEGQERMKTFVQKVQPAIAALELAGEERFDGQQAAVHVLEKKSLSHLYLPLIEAKVKSASSAPHETKSDDPDHVHRLIVTTSSGGSVSGSDEALAALTAELDLKPDNAIKLRASGANQCHLFVWLDGNTPYKISRPLEREAPGWGGGEWGIPSTAPRLDVAVTHLWVVHYGSDRGWLWDGKSWQELNNP